MSASQAQPMPPFRGGAAPPPALTSPSAGPPARLSIIVPTFNAAGTLAACLDSVTAQSWTDVEVLVVDGQSSDATLAIVAGYAARFPFIRCVSERDSGIYDAMNKGVARTRGDWLYFIGSDDALADAGALARVAVHFNAPVDLLYGNIRRMTTGRCEGRPFSHDDLIAQTICHQAIFYRRDLFRRLGGFDLAYRVCADWDFNIRCFGSGSPTRYVDTTVCHYSGSGLSATTTDPIFLARKLSIVAGAYRRSYWSRLFRSCRHEFAEAARQARVERRHLDAVRMGLVYAFHGALAGQAVMKLLRRRRATGGRVG